MATYTIREGQNPFDIAIQLYGDAQYIVKICIDNNLSLTADLVGFQLINYDDTILKQTNSTVYLALNGISIVSSDSNSGDDLVDHNASDYTSEEHN